MTKEKKIKPSVMKKILLAHDISKVRQKIRVLNFTAIVSLVLALYELFALGSLLTYLALGTIILICLSFRQYYMSKEIDLKKELVKE